MLNSDQWSDPWSEGTNEGGYLPHDSPAGLDFAAGYGFKLREIIASPAFRQPYHFRKVLVDSVLWGPPTQESSTLGKAV